MNEMDPNSNPSPEDTRRLHLAAIGVGVGALLTGAGVTLALMLSGGDKDRSNPAVSMTTPSHETSPAPVPLLSDQPTVLTTTDGVTIKQTP